MTKTILVLLLSGYSLTRLLTMAWQVYDYSLRLPYWVLGVSGACSVALLLAGIRFFLGRLRGGTLRLLMLVEAAATFVILMGLLFFPVSNLTTADLIITGTTFDILFFLGTLSLPLRDTARIRIAQDRAGQSAGPALPCDPQRRKS